MSNTSYQACARVVAQAIQRIPSKRIGPHDADDLFQELMVSALNAADRHDGRDHLGYVRVTVRNAVSVLYHHTLAAKRHPQDCYGRPVWFVNPDVLAWQVDEAAEDPEHQLAVREQIEQLRAHVSEEDRQLIDLILSDRAELTAADAKRIRYCTTGGF